MEKPVNLLKRHVVTAKPKARKGFGSARYQEAVRYLRDFGEGRASELIRERLWEQSNGQRWHPIEPKARKGFGSAECHKAVQRLDDIGEARATAHTLGVLRSAINRDQ
jgi:GNAT superfamily N-acetyltransferase